MSNAYNNVTAHYNAYFYALKNIKIIEESINESQTIDYNHILPVFPSIDSSNKEVYKALIEDCIKKSSIVIQYHKDSKWKDNSYTIIGQARMYGYDFPNAIETFKYVNTKGSDINAKHWALINLMRTFIESNEMNNAQAVSDFLAREPLNKKNLKQLYLMRAYYYQVMDQKDNMVQNLVASDSLLNKKERAKIYFIIGQVYQEIGLESAAFYYYKKCIKSNPKYKLSFYAKLNMTQVNQLKEKSDIKEIRVYFKKLIRDEKNEPFKDKIYHEWAKFELKKGYIEKSIANFNLSIQSSTKNFQVKGLSYLKIGEIYYDTLKRYNKAKVYYDSAIRTLPTTYKNYKAVAEKGEILTRFSKQSNIITLQDSLLNLATKDSAELMTFFIKLAKEEKEQSDIEESRKKVTSRDLPSSIKAPSSSIGKRSWYFTNLSAVSKGRTRFKQVWGERILEDHWRRSIKSLNTNTKLNKNPIVESTTKNKKSDLIDAKEMINKVAIAYYKRIPKTKEEIDASNKKIEDALYALGNIYYFELGEEKSATNNSLTLLKRYPKTAYEPEVLYLLYLIKSKMSGDKGNEYKDTLLNKYPASIYATLILNPQFLIENRKINDKLKVDYKKAYNLYISEDYESAKYYTLLAIKNFPKADFTANFVLLNILIIGKINSLPEYQLELYHFIKSYKKEPLNSYAKDLLKASHNYKNSLAHLKDAKYIEDGSDKDYFYIVFAKSTETHQVSQILENLISLKFSKNITVGSLKFDTENSYIVVKNFTSKKESLLFYDLLKSNPSIKNVTFVISKSNFEILYQTKELDKYLNFFQKNYY